MSPDDKVEPHDEEGSAPPALTELDIPSGSEPLPPEVDAFLTDAENRIELYFEHRAKRIGFFPSDYSGAYRLLRALHQQDDQARTLCEWGSGFGVVCGLAALAGFKAWGIEIDPLLVSASRILLRAYDLDVEILEGSFIPRAYAETEQFSDSDTLTILSSAGADIERELAIDDFDIIFAFPWPTEHEMFHDLFARFAADGALLITYDFTEGFHLFRKTGDLEPDRAVP